MMVIRKIATKEKFLSLSFLCGRFFGETIRKRSFCGREKNAVCLVKGEAAENLIKSVHMSSHKHIRYVRVRARARAVQESPPAPWSSQKAITLDCLRRHHNNNASTHAVSSERVL